MIADFSWFSKLKGNRYLSVDKPKLDQTSAPKPDCNQNSYGEAPADHQWCCRSHESREAEWSDQLAARRARGELNPQTWPPVRDGDGFDVSPAGAATGNPYEGAQSAAPDDQTIDDLE